MKITIIGSGYVGLVTGACLAEFGNSVVCLDIDKNKIDKLNSGIVPIFEPGLDKLIKENSKFGRILFTTDEKMAIEHGEVIFIAVGTPPNEDGSADLQYVVAVAEKIASIMNDYKVIVNKSTVPVGTGDLVETSIMNVLKKINKSVPFTVVSNPEFLKEGAAINDFMKPDRIIIGTSDEKGEEILRKLYSPFVRNHDRIIVMNRRSSEFTKYAANAMLATRISFMNELSILAEKVDANIEEVRNGIGSDPRIGYHFLYPGIGYGGSCFPKDVKALVKTGEEYNVNLGILKSVEKANLFQKENFLEKVYNKFGTNLSGKLFAIWGLSFKPETDDMREAPSIFILKRLLEKGAKVIAYDPIAMDEAMKIFGSEPNFQFASDPLQMLDGADSLIILTEWKVFRSPDFMLMKFKLNHPVIFDGRNLFDPLSMKNMGFEYYSIGRQPAII